MSEDGRGPRGKWRYDPETGKLVPFTAEDHAREEIQAQARDAAAQALRNARGGPRVEIPKLRARIDPRRR